jgi:hypothetical protein
VVYLVILPIIKLHSDVGGSMSMNMGWNDELSRKDQGTQRKICPIAASSTTRPTWTSQG